MCEPSPSPSVHAASKAGGRRTAPPSRSVRSGWLIGALLLFAAIAPMTAADPASAPQPSVATRLQELAQTHHFELEGVERMDEGEAPRTHLPLEAELKRLLQGINHVVLRRPDGSVRKVLILGRVVHPPRPAEIALPLRRHGGHYQVEATLVGADGKAFPVNLVVDTGATYVVLPESFRERLALGEKALKAVTVQTANGQMAARVGVLPALRLGAETVPDVAVAFVADEKLGGNRLLGITVLSRYRVTLDNAAEQLLLVKPER